ncbi:MAG: hypothetical protein HYR60_02840 [Acidobacteria bacterium]|nr:hypothetical protein [Acidobacteriota bacterium]
MTRKSLIALVTGAILCLVLALGASAADKKQARIDGRVHQINKDSSTIEVRVGTSLIRKVVYGPDTKYTYRNKPGSMDDVKDGRRVICLGKFDDKTQLIATRIDVREK